MSSRFRSCFFVLTCCLSCPAVEDSAHAPGEVCHPLTHFICTEDRFQDFLPIIEFSCMHESSFVSAYLLCLEPTLFGVLPSLGVTYYNPSSLNSGTVSRTILGEKMGAFLWHCLVFYRNPLRRNHVFVLLLRYVNEMSMKWIEEYVPEEPAYYHHSPRYLLIRS